MKKYVLIFVSLIALLVACTQSDDGPISIYPDGLSGEARGYLLQASLDSSRRIHLRSDSLPVALDSIWTLANCFLKDLQLIQSVQDTILHLQPNVLLELNGKDCATPEYRPDTTVYLYPNDSWNNVREIRIYDSDRNLEDSIALRSGKFIQDSIDVYVDSTFSDFYSLPRKTSKMPGILRTIDSLKERTFYWRPLPSRCAYIIDTCETVPDTIYPRAWSLRDTNLVPIRMQCKDSLERYCLARDWVNDTAKAGGVQTRLDTLWYPSWYLIFKMPRCGAVNKSFYGAVSPRSHFKAVQELFAPASDNECYSNNSSEITVYHLNVGDIAENQDSILSIYNTAPVGRDTL